MSDRPGLVFSKTSRGIALVFFLGSEGCFGWFFLGVGDFLVVCSVPWWATKPSGLYRPCGMTRPLGVSHRYGSSVNRWPGLAHTTGKRKSDKISKPRAIPLFLSIDNSTSFFKLFSILFDISTHLYPSKAAYVVVLKIFQVSTQ